MNNIITEYPQFFTPLLVFVRGNRAMAITNNRSGEVRNKDLMK